MRTGREEAIDIFRKWFAEESLLRVQGNFRKFCFALWGRILSINATELRIMSNTESELVLRLTPDVEFGYGDDRIVTGDEKNFSECILVFFEPVPDVGDPDTIAIAALKL